MRAIAALCLALLGAAAPLHAGAGEVEVLHFWTRGAEVGAVNKLRAKLREEGHTWKDFAVADGAGGQATMMLKSRVQSGNPPTAAQVNGASIVEWARAGALASIDDVALADHWDAVLPSVVSETMKYHGRYVAVPLNVHRVNWLWVNPVALKRANASLPTTWDEFFATAEALKKVGIIPIAYSGQAWLDMGTFESVLAGVGGPGLYRRAFIELDQQALTSPEMVKVLETYKRLKQYTSTGNRDWVVATAMLIKGEAGMQLMGDWVKAEIRAAGKQPGVDILCVPSPGSERIFTYDIDSFVMFNVSASNRPAQRTLARAVMDREFQQAFNLAKGSIPVRKDVRLDAFDACAKRSAQDFSDTSGKQTLLPSVANVMVLPTRTVSALVAVISNYWQKDSMTAQQAAQLLSQAARSVAPVKK